MDFNSPDREKGEKNQLDSSMVAAGSKIPPLDREKDEKNQLDSSTVVAESSKSSPFRRKEMAPAVSSPQNGNFLLKLKMPKYAQEIGKEGLGQSAEELIEEVGGGLGLGGEVPNFIFSHFCKECGKGFSSGKALGGHMSSAHVQAKDNLKKLKFRRLEDSLSAGYDSEPEKHVCKICDKEFPSSKSLYGHMRLHPERKWRGMEPPPSKRPRLKLPASPVVADDDEDYLSAAGEEDQADLKEAEELTKDYPAVDLTEFLTGRWALTGNRGRPARRKLLEMAELYSFPDDEKEQAYDAAHQLLSLVNGVPFKAESPLELSKNSSTPSAEPRDSINLPSKKRKFNQVVDYSSDSEETLDGTATARLDSKFQGEEVTSEKHKCSTCEKIFPSHQALGGHRSSHNKVKISVQNAFGNVGIGGNPGARVLQWNTESVVGGDAWKMNSESVHDCNICGKSFTSGQALGGHKRSHNFLGSSSCQVAVSLDEGGISHKSERKVLDFDLNIAPDIEDDSSGCGKF